MYSSTRPDNKSTENNEKTETDPLSINRRSSTLHVPTKTHTRADTNPRTQNKTSFHEPVLSLARRHLGYTSTAVKREEGRWNITPRDTDPQACARKQHHADAKCRPAPSVRREKGHRWLAQHHRRSLLQCQCHSLTVAAANIYPYKVCVTATG